jgi:hypothetical protein
MMESKLVERIEALLKEDGFTSISRTLSAHSATLSAVNGKTRFVMHINDQEEMPFRAERSDRAFPSADVRLTATHPGVPTTSAGTVAQGIGQGGALRNMERLKR